LATQRQIMMIRDARGDVDLNRLFGLHAPVATAARARVVDKGAFTAAGRAWRHSEELTEERLRLAPHFAGAAAGAALHRRRAWFGTGAGAFGAGVETLDADGLGRATRDFGEREFQADLDVVAPPPIATCALAAAEECVEARRAREPEVAHEHHEGFGQIEMHRRESATGALPAQS